VRLIVIPPRSLILVIHGRNRGFILAPAAGVQQSEIPNDRLARERIREVEAFEGPSHKKQPDLTRSVLAGGADCRSSDRRIDEIGRILDTYYGGSVSLPQLARRVNLSVSRIQHLFRASRGVPIMRSLRETRLQAAAILLVSTHLRVSEICYQVGFHQPSHFTHAFKRRFGSSPRAYRRTRAVCEDGNATG
jgi:AraC-like DNA-binding protein